MRTLEEKRDWAADGVARWEAKAAVVARRFAAARELGGGIPGFGGSGSQRAGRLVRDAYASADRAAREADEKLAYYRGKLAGFERLIAERDRARFTRDDLLDAVVVRTRFGWMEVVRLNQKSVTVEGVFGPQTVPFDRVLEFKRGAR